MAPDIACFGKALGNGVPISAIVGRADIMDDVAQTLDVYDRVFNKLVAWVDEGALANALDGRQVEVVFRAP